jgi:hypothetical protein
MSPPSDVAFPPSIIYSWTNPTNVEDISKITSELSRVSSSSVDWRLEVLLKIPKMQKSSGSQVSRGAMAASLAGGTYFFQFYDVGVTCICPKNNPSEILIDVDKSHPQDGLILRSTWTASGQKFYVGNCLISVGFIEHIGSPAKPFIEIVFIGEFAADETVSQSLLRSLVIQMHNIICDILTANGVIKTSVVSSPLITSLKSRTQHWLSMMS